MLWSRCRFRVLEFSFPILSGPGGSWDLAPVQAAVWEALDVAQALRAEGRDGLTDHLDLRLVAPSPLALSPTPLAPGVVAWACVALAATTTTPAEHWEALVDRVVARWANHTLLPRPHWGKEVPAMVGEEEAVAYLRRAYARELPGVVAAMGALVGGQGGGLQDTANIFGTPFTRQLFLI